MFTFFFFVACTFGDNPNDLIKNLGDNNYHVRKKTHEEIVEKIDFNLYLKLRRYKGNDAEITARIRRIVEPYEREICLRYSHRLVEINKYPKYPFIDSLPSEYPDKYNINVAYLRRARVSGVIEDGNPFWTNYRKATELWICQRVCLVFYEVIKDVKNQKEFQERMFEKTKDIQKDIRIMINGDDEYWKNKGGNPLRIKNNK